MTRTTSPPTPAEALDRHIAYLENRHKQVNAKCGALRAEANKEYVNQ